MASSGLEDLVTVLQGTCLLATRSAASLPTDLLFERSLSRRLAKDLDVSSDRCLDLLGRLLQFVRSAEGSHSRGLEEVDLIDNYTAQVTDIVDSLLEKADHALDRHRGKAVVEPAPSILAGSSHITVIKHNKQLAKPQLRFKRPINNERSSDPWIPLLTRKPHAQTPLSTEAELQLLPAIDKEISVVPHPYTYEIQALPPTRHLSPFGDAQPTAQTLDNESNLTYVDSIEGFRSMIEYLSGVDDIAVDLEHHDLRSYHGIVCLMQISSRTRDFIIDLLDPEVRQAAQELNEVFANPQIVKVFHGAESDIIWLQRDLGLYVVNLFDTAHAARVLHFPRASLAYLLDRYVGFQADKRYQMADWRMRPLGPEMLRYARADTHFLLYIYDQLRRALSHPESASEDVPVPLTVVMERSAKTALQIYMRIPFELDSGWQRLLEKWHKEHEWGISSPHLRVFRALYDWRDRTAREMDDSPLFVLPNPTLLSLAQRMPRETRDVQATLERYSPIAHKAAEIAEMVDSILASISHSRVPSGSTIRQTQAQTETREATSRTLPALFASRVDTDLHASRSSLLATNGTQSLLASKSALLGPAGRQNEGLTHRVASVMASISLGDLLGSKAAIAGIEASLAPTVAAAEAAAETEEDGHTFVPASSRTNTVVAPVTSQAQRNDDEIIIVKHYGKTNVAISPNKQSKKRSLVTVEAHDYSATPSVLDATSSVFAASPQSKRTKRSGGGKLHGPRMPKVTASQGGMTQTFQS